VVTVSVAAALRRLLGPLEPSLGAGYRLVTDDLDGSNVAVVGAVGAAELQRLRRCHPRPALLVVDPRTGYDTTEAVAYLDAGADGYLRTATVGEVAAHVRALSRSAARSPAHGPRRTFRAR
jgi:hypothetical protein